MGRNSRSSERGQAAVLSALVMFTMVVFVAMATNMGILTSDRIRIQNAADATAYAGAITQAQRMNVISRFNGAIADLGVRCRRELVGQKMNPNVWIQCAGPKPQCATIGGAPYQPATDPKAEFIIDQCAERMGNRRQYIYGYNAWETNYSQAGAVRRAAVNTANENFLHAGPGVASANTYIYSDVPGTTGMTRSPTWMENRLYGGSNAVPKFIMMLPPPSGRVDDGIAHPAPSMVDLQVAITPFAYLMVPCDAMFDGKPSCTPMDVPRSQTPVAITQWLYTWYGKYTWDSPSGFGDTLYNVYFPVKLFGTPAKQFFDIKDGGGTDGLFGATTTGGSDLLAAYAAAKPYGGKIGPMKKYLGDEPWQGWPDSSNPGHWTRPIGGTKVPTEDSILELIQDGWFVKLSEMNGTSPNDYRARVMGLQEEPNDSNTEGKLHRPVEMMADSNALQLEPGQQPNMPRPADFERFFLH